MAALVCDLCGGKLMMKAGGIAACDSCGMEHGADRIKEKVQEIRGVVKVDSSHMIENYLEMARNAKDSGNNTEAETYCNRIIEIDPSNHHAWMLKGEAAAWQSTLQDSRIGEGVNSFIRGINCAPEDEKNNLIDYAKEQIKSLSSAMLSLRANRFAKWPDEEESNGFLSDITAILNVASFFVNQTGEIIPLAELMAPAASQINQAVVKAWAEVIWPDYNGDPNDTDDRAGKYEWQTYIKRIGFCTTLIEQAIKLCDVDDDEDITRYENLIHFHEQAIDSCSWDYNFTDWGKSWHKEWSLTEDAIASRRRLIGEYQQKIREIKSAKAAKEAARKADEERLAREEADKRYKEYWELHHQEKQSLEVERDQLVEKVKALEIEISEIPGSTSLTNIKNQINRLNADKDSLGIFKGKEKKAIQVEIDRATSEMKILSERVNAAKAEINARITPMNNRIKEITAELTKAR